MSRKFQVKAVPSSWLANNGRRLDCGPYMSGAVEAKELLKKHSTEPLKDLTVGHNGGIFNGPRFPRVYVEDPTKGVPFLGSTDILDADLSFVPLLSRKQVEENPALLLDEGWTLITCSGTIGRMAYARSDMRGMAGSQHFMRISPDIERIKPGYLYAYLSSRFGVPIVVSGTYGAIIQHIEPHHIVDLPVPRLGAVEVQAHKLIQEAANMRSTASSLVSQGIAEMMKAANLDSLNTNNAQGIPLSISTTLSSPLLKRMDATFHSTFHSEVVNKLRTSKTPLISLSTVAESIFEPKRFKRIQIDNPKFGVPMFGTSSLMWAVPQPSFWIPKTMDGIDSLIIDSKTVLIPRSGQVSGIIGTAVLPFGALIGGAVSEHAIRVKCRDETEAGYVFIALRSEYGRRQLKSRTYGSSIPTLDVEQVSNVVIPNVSSEAILRIGSLGCEAARLRTEAICLEDNARALIECAIEEGGR